MIYIGVTSKMCVVFVLSFFRFIVVVILILRGLDFRALEDYFQTQFVAKSGMPGWPDH